MKYLITLLTSGLFLLGLTPQPSFAQKANFACSQHPSGVSTPSAKDPAFVDQPAYSAEGATWDYRWEADCSQGCSATSDCPQNTANQPAVKVNDSNWCFEFTDGNRCMMLTTTDKSLGQDKNASGGKYGSYGATSQTGSSSSSSSQSQSSSQQGASGTSTLPGNFSGPDNSAECKEPKDKQGDTEKAFFDAKVANNLVRFNAILKGVPDLCTPADLGVEPKIDIDGKRLLMCSGKKEGDNLPPLVWRLVDAQNNKLILAPGKPAPTRETIEKGFDDQGHLTRAKQRIGLIDTQAPKPAEPNPDQQKPKELIF